MSIADADTEKRYKVRTEVIMEPTLSRPEFTEAFQLVGELGIGSGALVRKYIEPLLRNSKWHQDLLTHSADNAIISGQGAFDDIDGSNGENERNEAIMFLWQAIFREIMTIAACYFAMGSMVGWFSSGLSKKSEDS